MNDHGLVFVSSERFLGSEMLAREFQKGLELSHKKFEARILCAHTGKSYEVAKEIGDSIKIPLTPSVFLESNKHPETTLVFVENYASACKNGELVFVVVNRNQFQYVRKHIREMAGYFVGSFYTVK